MWNNIGFRDGIMTQIRTCNAVQPPQPCRLNGEWSRRFTLKDSEKAPFYENLLRSHQNEAKHYLTKLCEDFSPEFFCGMIDSAKKISQLISEYSGKGQPIPEHLLRAQMSEFRQNFKDFERKISVARARISHEGCCPVEAVALMTFVHATTNKITPIVSACNMVENVWPKEGGKVDESRAKNISANIDAFVSKYSGMMLLREATLDFNMPTYPVMLIPDTK